MVLDFETYFDKTYHMRGKGGSGLSTIEFIMDPQFEEIGLGTMSVLHSPPSACRRAEFWHEAKARVKYLQEVYGPHLEKCTCLFHNARFDATILARHHGLVPRYTIDTLALARHLDAQDRHDLAHLCKLYKLPDKGDTMQFSGLRWAVMGDEQRAAMSAYCRNDVERTFDLFAVMLPRLTRPEVELALADHTLKMYLEPKLRFDAAEADRIIGLMKDEVALATHSGLSPTDLRSEAKFCALLKQAGADVPMKQGAKKMIGAFAKDDEGMKELLRHRIPAVRDLAKARLAVKSWPLHLKRVESMKAQANAAGGWLCNPLSYYGAHTGRWSGGEGINTQNFGKRGHDLITKVRGTLTAPTDCTLVICDAAQIEARGTAWISGCNDLLDDFRDNIDVYSDFAAIVTAMPCRKPRKTDPPPVAKVLTARRAIGKVGILGLGYGMGWLRALDYMMGYPELAPKIESGEISELFARDMVRTYRAKYARIVRFWADIEAAFRYVTRYGQPRELPHLKLWQEGTTTVIQLPSTRCLFYPHARVDLDEKISYQWGKLWGGTLTENIAQALSRDLMAEAILAVDKFYPVAHHVHDEIVAVVPKGQEDAAKVRVSNLMSSTPDWAPGLPLDAEAVVSDRYYVEK